MKYRPASAGEEIVREDYKKKITINDVDRLATPGDAFICSPGDVHSVWNKTDREFRLVVFKINLPERGEDSYWHE
jgi:quercetin dioxygenase-like cupin family protein